MAEIDETHTLGHASITLTSHHLHHVGDTADKAALAWLNNRGGVEGQAGVSRSRQ